MNLWLSIYADLLDNKEETLANNVSPLSVERLRLACDRDDER